MRTEQISTASGIDLTIEESGAIGMLKLKGALTERQVAEIGKRLERMETQVSYFKINLEKVTAVDLRSIQALYATCENLVRLNKRMTLDGLCPVIFTSAVENMGLSNHRWLCFGQL